MSAPVKQAIESVRRSGGRPVVVGELATCSTACPHRRDGALWTSCGLTGKVRRSTWCDAVVALVRP